MRTDNDLMGRVAIVTGGSGGIGSAIAVRLAEAGNDVAVTYATNPDRAHRTVDAIEAHGRRGLAIRADLTDPHAGVAAIDDAVRSLGAVTVLVANAAIARQVSDVADVDIDLWRKTMDVNTVAPFLQCQRLLPDMVDAGFGRILFTSSVAAYSGGVVGPHYAASKAALHGLIAWLAGRNARHGITINAIAPALIDETSMRPDAPAPPIGRFGTPEEVATIAHTMLASPYVTGKIWTIDGGLQPYR